TCDRVDSARNLDNVNARIADRYHRYILLVVLLVFRTSLAIAIESQRQSCELILAAPRGSVQFCGASKLALHDEALVDQELERQPHVMDARLDLLAGSPP